MTLKFKQEYLNAVRTRYFNSTKKGKSQILDEMCAITGYSRKAAIRVLSLGHNEGKKASGRTNVYSPEAIKHLKNLWHMMGRICSKKMVAALPVWINFYDRAGITNEIKNELKTMSSSTIDRYLKTYKRQFARLKRTGTRRSKKFMNVVPIKDLDHFAKKPGFIQADTVSHGGNNVSGLFIWTMTVTDEFTGWTECRAMYGKGGPSPIESVHSALSAFPFDIHSFNTDNGSEFLNERLHNYICAHRGIKFTRSRPYKKNDNAHVEQKNFTHVRELFGYERFDFEDLTDQMNIVYAKYFCVLQNFFIPQMKLSSKVRVGSKYYKKYHEAKTPFQRVLDSPDIPRYQKELLKKQFEQLNPVLLKKDLNYELNRFKVLFNKLKRKRALERAYYENHPAYKKKAA